MKRITLYIFLLFILPLKAFSADSAVVKLILPKNGTYYNLSYASLYTFQNNRVAFHSSYYLTGEQTHIKLPVEMGQMVLRFVYDTQNNKYFDLLFPDGDTTEVETGVISPTKHPVIRKGTINREYYSYLAEKDAYEARLSKLEEKYKSEADKKQKKVLLNQINENYKHFSAYCIRKAQANRYNLAGLLIANTPVRQINPTLSEEKQKQQLITTFWKGVNLRDTALLRTYLFYELLEEYIGLHFEEKYTQEQQEAVLYSAIDNAMKVFEQTEQHKDFAYSFLKNGFEAINHDKMVQYLAVNYQTPEQCSSEEDAEEVRRLQAAYNKLKKGNQAPEIELSDSAGRTYFLKDIEADTLLIIFWSSSCSHCTETLPVVAESVSENWKTVAVSLDQHKETYLKYISKYPDWIHYCDFNGWKSKPVTEYFITGTPSFILLDSKRRIIDKFNSWEQVAGK